MASSSDGMFDPGISFSSMKQPPLIKQLKGILSEYPDGGQILKELIQNAEDAEATEVRILYDGRNINEQVSGSTPKFNKFFKGPALCVFNDAIFTEDDWDGIRMIYSSVKEENPLKVGRFGLGFKSVFHITDYPCVISGNKLLMIDPQRPSDRVNAMVNLSGIGSLENCGLTADAFWTAFEGTFGMNRECVKNDFFQGTIFWFPLRQTASELSETLYDELKVMNLLDSFQSEASCILLFLKNLERITVCTRKQSAEILEVIRVEIDDDNGKVNQKRRNFKEKIKEIGPFYEGEDLRQEILFSVARTIQGRKQIHKWMVVNYFVGNTAKTNFRELITDKSLGYSPYVSVAAPVLSSKNHFEGHVYCFLPLPREGSRLTGLPVHVNGFFALSQNRHHLKWETDEQKGRQIDDKAILWNRCLIEEALPKAYDALIQALISMAVSRGNTSELVELVYACLPTSSNVQSRWTLLENKLYARLSSTAIFYNAYNNKWVSLQESVFATFDGILYDRSRVQHAVTCCLNEIGKYYVDISPELFKTLKRHHSWIQDLTPKILSQYLLQNSVYRNMSSSCKLDILTYILSDNVYEKLDGLELLPLRSGEWESFKRSGEEIFYCNEDVLKILPGQEKRIVLNTSSLENHFKQLCSNGLFQVRSMTSSHLVSLLEKTIACYLGVSAKLQLNSSTYLSVEWLQQVWHYIITTGDISNFTTLGIMPVLKSGTWKKPNIIDLVSLSKLLLVRTKGSDNLSDGVCRCFEVMGVSVLESLPEWIPENFISQFCFWPTSSSIMVLLSEISSFVEIRDITAKFNQTCSVKDRIEFRTLLVKSQFEMKEEASQLIRDLQLFPAVNFINESGFDTSVSHCPLMITGSEKFPISVKLPFTCIKIESSLVEAFIIRLGARKVSVDDLVTETLKRFVSGLVHTKDEKGSFIDYFVSNFHLFKDNTSILQLARQLYFLRTNQNSREYRAEELFDLSDALINDLLYGESLVPESNTWTNGENIKVLRYLGLKELSHLDSEVVLQVAVTLDQWCRERNPIGNMKGKAEALLKLLCSRPTLLSSMCANGLSLGERIKSLACLPVQDRVTSYPKCLKWYQQNSVVCKPLNAKEASLNFIIGAVVPTVACESEEVIDYFQWREPPALCHIFEQFKMIRKCYSVVDKSEVLPVIKALYEHLSEREDEILKHRSVLSSEQVIWTGEEFVDAGKVIVYNEKNNIDLRPYFFSLPEEYSHIRSMFMALGCHRQQDSLIFQKALYAIRDAHHNSQHYQTVRRDRRIVIEVLERISKTVQENVLSITDTQLLIMVQDVDPNKLTLRPVSECSYDDDPACFYQDDGIFLVHEMIAVEIAESLGVKSITRRFASDAEELGVEEWGQKEHLTTRIHALLRDGYTDGLSVPKELIQNADDAGATSVKFLYDERQNLQMRERVLSKGMKAFQGPALWVFNNAKFSDDDLRNITKLNAATKQKDVKKIGKFGLGFCSVYNLTDMPSFITGSSIIFFDPHEKHLGSVIRSKGTGLKYRLPNKNLVSRHIDQFKPYDGIFECNITQDTFSEYNGTLFRLPLRTEQQAKESQINSVSYTHEEMIQFLHMFIKAAGNMLIFSQNVRYIEIYHLAETATSASEAKVLFKVHKDSLKMENHSFIPVTESILNRMPIYLQQKRGFHEIHNIFIKQIVTSTCKNMIKFLDDVAEASDTVWLVSWAKGSGKSLDMSKSMLHEGAVPLSATAVPCQNSQTCTPISLINVGPGFYQDGHLFCFLPLPLSTDLPLHINGCFAVKSDRRQLACTTEDDKSNNQMAWNTALLEDASVASFFNLLEALTGKALNVHSSYNYYDIWPIRSSKDVLPFQVAFYRNILDSPVKVFYGKHTWVAFEDVMFMDPNIQQQTYGDLTFEVMSHFAPNSGKVFIEMPSYIFENIRQNNLDKLDKISLAVISEKEFFLTVLRNVHDSFWTNRLADRNLLIAAAITSSDSDVEKVIQSIKCIPTDPFQTLNKPNDLIHPNSSVSRLFSVGNERFPIDTKEFRSDAVLKKLEELGMSNYILPPSLLVDRCESISSIAEICCICAHKQFVYMMEYLCDDKVLALLEKDNTTKNIIMDLCMFPVLSKPNKWTFSWYANAAESSIRSFNPGMHCQNHSQSGGILSLGRLNRLYRESLCDYIGSIACIIDETMFKSAKIRQNDVNRLFQTFCVKGDPELPTPMLVDQLCLISCEYVNKKVQYEEVRRLHKKIFQKLETVVKNRNDDPQKLECLSILRDMHVVLIGNELVRTEQVAFCLKEEYQPDLCKVPFSERNHFENIYKYLGVKRYFDVKYIIDLMVSLKQKWQCKEKSNTEHITVLLLNLKYIMDRTDTKYDDLREFHDLIYAPDTNCELWPTYELATENLEFESDVYIKTLHGNIPPSLGEALGAKAKEFKCFENISVGISFGQHERLVTRIQGLLKAYPCDASIMKELLQNADDAGASEIYFIKDYRTHLTDRLFSKSCSSLQGPSLCVYNNSYFTKDDLKGIHDLGHGSKCNDPSKTGQYGVGFNAVYHLTDTPSFISIGPQERDSYLLVLDPLCKHVPKATEANPGQLCKLIDVQNNFPNHLLGFSQDILITEKNGTVFRFPLRSEESEIGHNITQDLIDSLLNTFKEEMHEAVLFLKNIKCIKLLNLSTGKLTEEFSVKVQLSDTACVERKLFNEKVRSISNKNKNEKDKNIDIKTFKVVYPLNVIDSSDFAMEWLIVQQFGPKYITSKAIELQQRLKDNDIGLLPLGGVAIPLVNTNKKANHAHSMIKQSSLSSKKLPELKVITKKQENKNTVKWVGKLFCFLPLTALTGLPVHINGHFALDQEGRRELWKDGYQMDWNKFILETIVVPSWMSGLFYIQKRIHQHVKTKTICFDVQHTLSEYYGLFPIHCQAESQLWKCVVSWFYLNTVSQKAVLFPYIKDREHDESSKNGVDEIGDVKFLLDWTHLASAEDPELGGVFNIVSSKDFNSPYNNKQKNIIISLLRSFGIKLLETPRILFKELCEAGIADVPLSSPAWVMKFLKGTSCDVGLVNVNISSSKFRTVENLCALYRFISTDATFVQEIKNLPVLLTKDGTLKVFSEENVVFITRYSSLLPNSSCLFVHRKIRRYLTDEKLFELGLCKQFNMKDLLNLLPLSVESNEFAAGSEIRFDFYEAGWVPRSKEWLGLLFDFLYSQSKVTNRENDTQDKGHCVYPQMTESENNSQEGATGNVDFQLFRENIDQLKEWSLLPCIKPGIKCQFLVPFRNAPFLLQLPISEETDNLVKAFQKLYLPMLDTTPLIKCSSLVSSTMLKLIPSLESPSDVLECLLYHRNKIQECCAITIDDATEIMAYFWRKFSVLQNNSNQNNVTQKLRKLPLFVTLQGTLTSIDGDHSVFVIPKEVPLNGIQEWANICNIILLQEKEAFSALYATLEIEKTDIGFFYGEMLLPKINKMSSQHWMKHICFLRDHIGHQISKSSSREKIIQELSEIAFVNVNGVMMRVRQLYDPKNEVFKVMKDIRDFPPESFREAEWEDFLKELGLICKVTDNMIIAFARKIEVESKRSMSDEVCKKSKIILEEFLKNHETPWKESTLEEMKNVRFIKPFAVNSELLQIWPQHDNGRMLICFHGSTSSTNTRLCWTSIDLLCQKVFKKLDTSVRNLLGIHDEPPVENVIRHCQNICQVLKCQIKDRRINREFIECQMTRFYEYFTRHKQRISLIKSMLKYTPFVHLDKENDLVLTNEVIIDLHNISQIKPYLYRAPNYYGKFHSLFKMLGSDSQILFIHYANILRRLKDKCKDSEMMLPEKSVAKKVLNGLLCLNLDKDRSSDEVQCMYLPSKDLVMRMSTELTVPNDTMFENRLGHCRDIKYFVDMSFLNPEATYIKLDEVFSKWPTHLRPNLLSDVVEECICLDIEDQAMQTPKSRRLENFFHSQEFTACLCGILKVQFSGQKKDFGETLVVETEANLRSIRVLEMPSLRTFLKYQGRAVSGSEWPLDYHITRNRYDKQHSQNTFYFKNTNENDYEDITSILDGLFILIQNCLPEIDNISTVRVMTLLQHIDRPEELTEILERFKIMPLISSRREYFPKPGTYVESIFIPFLEQGIEPFKDFEYNNVAMELEDNDHDSNDTEDTLPAYIYVKILQEISTSELSGDLGRLYVVRTGTEFTEQVPIFRLYRFVRRQENPGTDMLVFDTEPIHTMPFDEQCNRIRKDLISAWELRERDRKRIKRRLLLKWHPDKNCGSEYCKDVFQYMQIVISRLEDGVTLKENIADEMTQGPSHHSQSSSRYYHNLNRTAQKQSRAYHENYEEYCRNERMGAFSHFTFQHTLRTDTREAKRWIRQAKNDLQAAEAMCPAARDVNGYNWICYLCHQACEKALKSAKYNTDANRVPKGSKSHCLTLLTSEPAFLEQARAFESRFSDSARFRYPDAVTRPDTPSDLFKKDDAEFAIETAKKLISLVDDDIS